MVIIGCDFHPGFQQIAVLDAGSGEVKDLRLAHKHEAQRFYASLRGEEVLVGIEASGYSQWFEQMLEGMGHRYQVGAAGRLMSHPGVGPVTALAFVLTIGDVRRFEKSRQVASYLGLIPAERSSGGKQRLGHIGKQGNSLLRFLLVEAGHTAVRKDAELRRCYQRLQHRHSTGAAKVAVARKLALRLYWMLRKQSDYAQLRGPYAGKPASFCGRETRPAA